jgi:glyoxylase-like metal-dependent hydrolase (beta-lactamase superfamily II)
VLNAVETAVELSPRLWRWEAYHPSWKKVVASVLVQAGDDVVLIDPLAPQGDAAAPFWDALDEAAAAGGRLTVVVTVPDHARSAPAIVSRFPQTPVHVALRRARRSLAGVDAAPLEESTPLPAGLRAYEAGRSDERVIWIAPHRTLVVGDVLLGTATGGLAICPEGWLPKRVTRAAVAGRLDELLQLEIERVIPTHGAPPAESRTALAAALAEARS